MAVETLALAGVVLTQAPLLAALIAVVGLACVAHLARGNAFAFQMAHLLVVLGVVLWFREAHCDKCDAVWKIGSRRNVADVFE